MSLPTIATCVIVILAVCTTNVHCRNLEEIVQEKNSVLRNAADWLESLDDLLTDYKNAAQRVVDSEYDTDSLIRQLRDLRIEVRRTEADDAIGDVEATLDTVLASLQGLSSQQSGQIRQAGRDVTRLGNAYPPFATYLLAVQDAVTELPQDTPCTNNPNDDRYTVAGGVCYYIEDEELTWPVAVQRCSDKGMGLISVTSEQQQQHINDMQLSINHLYTSGSYVGNEFVWTAVDNQPLTAVPYTNWWNEGQLDMTGGHRRICLWRAADTDNMAWLVCDDHSYHYKTSVCQYYPPAPPE